MATITKDPNAKLSTHTSPSTNKLLQSQAHTLQVFADYSVWDTVSNKYLQEGKDYDAKQMFRNG